MLRKVKIIDINNGQVPIVLMINNKLQKYYIIM